MFSIAVITAVLSIACGITLPTFYTLTDSFSDRLTDIVHSCKSSTGHPFATLEEDDGLQLLTIRTAQSQSGGSNPRAVRIILLYGEHARELISPQVALQFAEDLCTVLSGGLLKGSDGSSAYAQALTDVATSRAMTIKLIPLANPWGRKRVESGDYCVRTNENGVDLNRNYDAHWLPATANTPKDSFPGPAPFSESETQAIRTLLTEFRPHIFLSTHSGTLGMYAPPAYTVNVPEQGSVPAMMHILKRVAAETNGGHIPVGGAAKRVGYLCPGTALDYAFENIRAPYTFAFEVYDAAVGPTQQSMLHTDGLRRKDTEIARFVEKSGAVVVTSCFAGERVTEEMFIEESSGLSPQDSKTSLRANRFRFADVTAADGSTSSASAFLSSEECLGFFNPLEEAVFTSTVDAWTLRTAKLLQYAHEQVLQDHVDTGLYY